MKNLILALVAVVALASCGGKNPPTPDPANTFTVAHGRISVKADRK